VSGHSLPTGIFARADAEQFPAAGGDQGSIRLVGAGTDPVSVVELRSADREWAPRHSHPWDELTYVVDGTMEFQVGDQTGRGGPGALVSLPRDVPHTLRVPEGEARYVMITIGAPSVGFLREVGQAYSEGPTLGRLLEIAARHGVKPAF
jgi:quercetin dioxygenase-like cupin family protein